MKLKVKKRTPLVEFRAIPAELGEPNMSKMRGNPQSKILLIAPPCSEAEYDAGLPFACPQAQLFHGILEDNLELDTDSDFLIVSCSRCNLKPNKHSTDPIKDFVKRCAQKEMFERYIVVGQDAFRFMFHNGRKVAMTTIQGEIMYLPELKHRPLFVFPSVAPLLIEDTGDNYQDYVNKRIQAETAQLFIDLLPRFVKFLTL